MTLDSTDCPCLVLTVFRLLKRCFGASWPLQFFTYMLQLNSPSLQSTKHTKSGRLFGGRKKKENHKKCMSVGVYISTFRQQQLMSIFLAPASWFQIPRVCICPEIITFRVTIKMEPQPITLDLHIMWLSSERKMLMVFYQTGGRQHLEFIPLQR